MVHFGTQRSFVDGAPCAIDHWYHTGQMRQLRSDLSRVSGCHIGWQGENRSMYTEEFTIQYNKWFSKNETRLYELLEDDFDLYGTYCSS